MFVKHISMYERTHKSVEHVKEKGEYRVDLMRVFNNDCRLRSLHRMTIY